MGFKLGTERGLETTGGEIKTKMRFGKQSGEEGSVPGTPVIRVPLEEGILGEANMDGSIHVSSELEPGSYEDRGRQHDRCGNPEWRLRHSSPPGNCRKRRDCGHLHRRRRNAQAALLGIGIKRSPARSGKRGL